MLRQFLVAKIHRAVVTARDVDYPGSITIDRTLMDAAGILAWERVQVVDVNNGKRLETYVIPGEPDQGEIKLNGAAAHLVELGDKVIIMSYALMTSEELKDHCPKVVVVDEHNRITDVHEERL